MTRIGIIDNLQNINYFQQHHQLEAPAEMYSQAVGGNTGNLAFVAGTNQVVGNKKVRIEWGTPPDHARTHVDQLVICCANQIGSHADLAPWEDRLKAFNLPVTLVGLGAQTPNYESEIQVPEGTKKFLDMVTSLRPDGKCNIGVRGEYTQAVLKKIGFDSTVTGCPSLYISGNVKLGQSIFANPLKAEEARILVAAGNPYHKETAALEQMLVKLVNKTHGAYIVQHPTIMIALARSRLNEEEKAKLPNVLAAYGNLFDAAALTHWFRRNAYAFCDANVWMDFIRHYDATVGPRFHGVAFSVQMGKPSMVVHIDNRTRELATTSGIKSISAKDFADLSLDEVIARINWTREEADSFDKNRHARAKVFSEFLAASKITASDRLMAIANAG